MVNKISSLGRFLSVRPALLKRATHGCYNKLSFRDQGDRVTLAHLILESIQQEGRERKGGAEDTGSEPLQVLVSGSVVVKVHPSTEESQSLRALRGKHEQVGTTASTWMRLEAIAFIQAGPAQGSRGSPSHTEAPGPKTLPLFLQGNVVLEVL